MPIEGAHPVPCVSSSKHSFAIFTGADQEVAVWGILTADVVVVATKSMLAPFTSGNVYMLAQICSKHIDLPQYTGKS